MDDKNLDMLEEDTMQGKYLTFTLGEESYGIDILYVTEIIGIQPITIVPEFPDFIKGIINLRGNIIPVMDMRSKFNKSLITYNDRTCVIVVNIESISIGMIVDAVSDVLIIEDENIVPPPIVGGSGRKYIKSIGKYNDKVILIVDCDKLLNEAEVLELNQNEN